MMEANVTDSELRQDIIDELEFDPSFDGEHIGVAVDKNVVSLSGHVNSYAEKVAAIAAVQDTVNVLVQDGWVTLTGRVEWNYSKTAAEDDIRKLSGVCGVTNKIMIKQPDVVSSNIKSRIESALKRHVEVEASAIRVIVKDGNKVVLEGKVDNWDERRAVENAAWSAPGVVSVEDRLTIA
jgi:osmotically-inducible protein OsmY